jgi:hypothetical protein
MIPIVMVVQVLVLVVITKATVSQTKVAIEVLVHITQNIPRPTVGTEVKVVVITSLVNIIVKSMMMFLTLRLLFYRITSSKCLDQ